MVSEAGRTLRRRASSNAATISPGRINGLEKLGIWNSVRAAVTPAENVRAALLLVSRRDAPLGIVYATDAAADPGVKIAGVFPEDTHPPIVYPIALTADSKNPNAARLLQFLTSLAARPIFEKRGFTLLQ